MLYGGLGDDVFLRESGIDALYGGDGADTFQFDNRDTGVKTLADFEFGVDLATFRIDGGYFADTSIKTINNNQAHVSTVDDLIKLVGAVLSDDGEANSVSVDDGTLTLVIDADDHPRGDLTLIFEGGATAIQTEIYEALVASGAVPAGSVPPAPGGNGDGFILNGVSSKGDDIYFGTAGANSFRFESDEATEDGTRGTTDEAAHVDVIVGFDEADTLSFRIDGGFFAGLGDIPPDVDQRNNNQASVAYGGIDELGAFLNDKSTANAADQSRAFYDVDTNSTVLVIDDSPTNPDDDLTIVLWDAGDLL
ncbi:MAG: hypothetical protein AAGJ28_00700 [Pseudomonadota bacterium]